jgi:hypothetical protein
VQTKSGQRIRQRPGKRNALGQVKFEMPNAHAIYLHDTPAKGLFSAARARSAMAASESMMWRAGGPCRGCGQARARTGRRADRDRADAGSASGLHRLFTAEAQADGDVTFHEDPYNRDRAWPTPWPGGGRRPARSPDPPAEPVATPRPCATAQVHLAAVSTSLTEPRRRQGAVTARPIPEAHAAGPADDMRT